MNKKSLGFTLIELLVVVAIISLLSSIVLAAVKDARDKAKARAFRAEMQQLITALEMYRLDNGKYPGEGSIKDYYRNNNNSEDLNSPYLDLPSLLKDYLSKTPIVKDPTTSLVPNYLYRSGTTQGTYLYKCVGDILPPPYTISITNSATKITKEAVKDWRSWQFSTDGGLNYSTTTTTRCYSPR